MNLYKDGKFVEKFKDQREIEILREYVAKHAERRQVTVSKEVKTTILEESAEQHNTDGTVMVLNSNNFDKAIQDGHIFVKFYAPW